MICLSFFIINSIVILLILLVIISIVFFTIRNGISPTPTSYQVKQQFLQSILSIKPTGNVYELGAGWGTIAFPLAKMIPKVKVHAIENSHIPLCVLKVRSIVGCYNNMIIHRKNMYQLSLADADVVICYLFPKAMEKLALKFAKELKPGTMIISQAFAIPNWIPEQIMQVNDLYKTKIYVYIVK